MVLSQANRHPTEDDKACWERQLEFELGEALVGHRLAATHPYSPKEPFILPGDCGSDPPCQFVIEGYQRKQDSKAAADNLRWWLGIVIALVALVIMYLGVASALHWWPF